MVLERNGDYWEKDLPILDRIEFRIIPEETARLAAIRAGDVDLTVLNDPKNARLLKDDKNVNLNDVPSFWRSASPFNITHKPLDDVRVRQAISYAIDRQEIINTVLLGDGVPPARSRPAKASGRSRSTPRTSRPTSTIQTRRAQLLEGGRRRRAQDRQSRPRQPTPRTSRPPRCSRPSSRRSASTSRSSRWSGRPSSRPSATAPSI